MTSAPHQEVIDRPETQLATVPQNMPMVAMPIEAMKQQVNQIQLLMREVMVKDEHFGTIPGCGTKNVLMQSGAQKLCLTFGFAPQYRIDQTDLPNGHREYQVICTLISRTGGQVIGEGVGCCSTMEGKYRFRTGPKKVTSREVPSSYWNLRKSNPAAAQQLIGKGNSTAKDENNVWRITEGGGAKIEHDNPADNFNTCLKMAKKRAYVDATLTATAASDIFTQDLDDNVDAAGAVAASTATPAHAVPMEPVAQQQATTQQQPPIDPSPAQAAPAQAAPPVSQAPPAATQPVADGLLVTAVTIKKEGTSEKGPWTIWCITTNDGKSYDTFNAADSNIASDAKASGQCVVIESEQTKYGFNLKSISIIGDAPQQQQTQQPDAAPDAAPQTVACAIIKVDAPRRVGQGDQATNLYGIDTSAGRFGALGDELGDMAKQNAGNGVEMIFTYTDDPRGRLATAIEISNQF